jgi:rhodanese-related sulfurtransferase
MTCHTAAPTVIRGNFDNLVMKSSSFQVKVDEAMEVLHFDRAALKVQAREQGATLEDTLKAIKKGHEVAVEFTEAGGVKTAKVLRVKPPVTLAVEDSIPLTELERLVALGPEKGGFLLGDCRPAPRFQEGSIPGAVNLPFPAFDKLVDRLPADKGKLIVYFCSGKTCNMGPGSLRKAQKRGYTNVKVYVDGMPGWYAKHFGGVAPRSFQEAYAAKDIPAVVLDLRDRAAAEQGAIPGAVAVDPKRVADLLKAFPEPKLKPPVLVADAEGGEAARAVADQLVRAGYAGVNVLQGGMKAWKAEGLPLSTGPLAAKVAYVPRPRPGSIPSAEFSRIALLPPDQRQGVVILDVRYPDETRNGSIRGAFLIPEPELAARLAELPKGKRVLVHCSTGVRAELAYHLLKERGHEVAFLNQEITIIDSGEFILD